VLSALSAPADETSRRGPNARWRTTRAPAPPVLEVTKVESSLGALFWLTPTFLARAIAGPVGYASDPKVCLSATPATLIGAVDGVGDRM
jgi:hypothetical protein